jgi:Spy/CpxP family protein refolding chaperone
MVQHLTRELELDDTQQQKVENIVTAAEPEMEALHDRVEVNMNAMHELDVSDDNYDVRLNELAAEKGALASEQALLHGRLKAEINAVLTPEQRQQLAEKADTMREHFKERRQKHSRG